MSTLSVPTLPPPIDYPESDGLPMAENTLQYQWIVTIVGGLRHLFDNDPNVFVAGDLFWYPVQGHPEIRMAPDAMVAFGRPAGHRGSYRQWEEAGIAPQVVFEVLSPSNRRGEMRGKLEFYRRYGVEEYYVYDPDRLALSGYLRKQGRLVEIEQMQGHESPRLGIKFEMGQEELTLIGPDGNPFLTFEEYARREEQERQRAEEEHKRAESAKVRAKRADARAKQERARAAEERARAKQERARAKQADELAKKERARAKQADDLARKERDRANRLQRELDELRARSAPPGSGEA